MRLLAALLVLCSMSMFAQSKPAASSHDGGSPFDTFSALKSSEVSPAEPWRVVPSAAPNERRDWPSHTSPANGRKDSRNPQFNLLSEQNGSDEGQAGTDLDCLAIRSYLVARDSPDSDSTHLVGYTTCVPSRKIRLKSTLDYQQSER
jgi:hypothetical protein